MPEVYFCLRLCPSSCLPLRLCLCLCFRFCFCLSLSRCLCLYLAPRGGDRRCAGSEKGRAPAVHGKHSKNLSASKMFIVAPGSGVACGLPAVLLAGCAPPLCTGSASSQCPQQGVDRRCAVSPAPRSSVFLAVCLGCASALGGGIGRAQHRQQGVDLRCSPLVSVTRGCCAKGQSPSRSRSVSS